MFFCRANATMLTRNKPAIHGAPEIVCTMRPMRYDVFDVVELFYMSGYTQTGDLFSSQDGSTIVDITKGEDHLTP
jgi:hypothetical protein